MGQTDTKYCVYMHTNKINGKKYVGITSKTPEQRWQNGNGYKRQPYFWNAIKKYGWDNFEHIIMFSGLTLDEANAKEIELIAKYNTQDVMSGYNIEAGGKCAPCSDIARKHLSEALTGRKRIITDEWRKHLSESSPKERPWQIGKCHTQESKEKISQALKSHNVTKEAKEKMSLNSSCTIAVICDDIEYRSITECAKYYNVKPETMASWLGGRNPIPEKFVDLGLSYANSNVQYVEKINPFHKKVYYNGVIYSDAKELSLIIGVHEKTIRNWAGGKQPMPIVHQEKGLKFIPYIYYYVKIID